MYVSVIENTHLGTIFSDSLSFSVKTEHELLYCQIFEEKHENFISFHEKYVLSNWDITKAEYQYKRKKENISILTVS